jgi:hypothetical protein
MRRFLPKRLGSLALTCPKQPPIRNSSTPDQFTALGRDTSGAEIPSRARSLECREERLPYDTPSPLKQRNCIVRQNLESGDVSNRDFGFEMDVSAFQDQYSRFWR